MARSHGAHPFGVQAPPSAPNCRAIIVRPTPVRQQAPAAGGLDHQSGDDDGPTTPPAAVAELRAILSGKAEPPGCSHIAAAPGPPQPSSGSAVGGSSGSRGGAGCTAWAGTGDVAQVAPSYAAGAAAEAEMVEASAVLAEPAWDHTTGAGAPGAAGSAAHEAECEDAPLDACSSRKRRRVNGTLGQTAPSVWVPPSTAFAGDGGSGAQQQVGLAWPAAAADAAAAADDAADDAAGAFGSRARDDSGGGGDVMEDEEQDVGDGGGAMDWAQGGELLAAQTARSLSLQGG